MLAKEHTEPLPASVEHRRVFILFRAESRPPTQGLVYSRCSINMCQVNERIQAQALFTQESDGISSQQGKDRLLSTPSADNQLTYKEL